VGEELKPTPVDPPRGFFSAHVDEKGRLKLPTNFQQYLSAIGDQRFFVTSLDRRIARIYPISVWEQNEKVMSELSAQDPDAAEALGFTANDLGADAKLDPQGRMTLPTELRRELDMENQEVRLACFLGAIDVYSMKEYDARKLKARENLPASLVAAKKMGFK
jgi:MraZ protein